MVVVPSVPRSWLMEHKTGAGGDAQHLVATEILAVSVIFTIFQESKVISPLSLRSCCVRWFSADMDAFVISCVGVSATAGRELASFSADTDFGNLLGSVIAGG
jgi:hypothetical protein